MYENLKKNLTTGVRLMTGVVFLLVGIIWQIISHKTLDMYAFYIMAAGALCFVQVILAKLSGAQMDLVGYVVLNMIVLIAGFAISGAGWFEGMVLYGIWGICLLVDWVLNIALVTCEGMAKRGVMGFVAVVLNVVLIGVLFMIPVLMAAWR